MKRRAAIAFLLSVPVMCIAQGGSPAPTSLKIISGTSPGSTGDALGRIIADAMAPAYKDGVLVENRLGAGGLIGAMAIRNAPADGSVIGIAATSHLVAPLLQDKPSYRPLEDFTPLSELASIPNVVLVSSSGPFRTLADLARSGRRATEAIAYGSAGMGTASHVGAEILNGALGIHSLHVPFKQVSDLTVALADNQIHYMIFPVPAAIGVLGTGRARALAVSGSLRSTALPDVPTFREAGFAGADSYIRVGLVGPAHMPPEAVIRLHRQIQAALRSPQVVQRFAVQGATPTLQERPEQYLASLAKELAQYKSILNRDEMRR